LPYGVLVIEDEVTLARNIKRYLERHDYEVRLASNGAEGLAQLEAFKPDIVLLDLNLPDATGIELLGRIRQLDTQVRVILITAYGSVQVAVEAMKAGAHDFLTKPVALGELRLLIDKVVGQERLEGALSYYHDRDASGSGLDKILGQSPPLLAMKAQIARLVEAERQLRDSEPPAVLVLGETGTGKELVARALHFEGARRDGPFIEVNAAAMPAHLVEAELFGHERGAFTDARERRLGLVEAAHGGTLFLDEIGDLDLAVQVKLLKLLEDRTVRRLGSARDHRVDVRFVTATHRALEELVQDGRFRADLYYRLRVVSVRVPPLRERGEDVIRLAEHFLELHACRYGKLQLTLSDEARAVIRRHGWPGSVRELRNAMEQAVLSAPGEVVAPEHLALFSPGVAAGTAPPVAPSSDTSLPDMERSLIVQALAREGGNVSRAARALGISRDTLRYRMEKHGLQTSA
jgi:DNA-binding NtrC family response regulator